MVGVEAHGHVEAEGRDGRRRRSRAEGEPPRRVIDGRRDDVPVDAHHDRADDRPGDGSDFDDGPGRIALGQLEHRRAHRLALLVGGFEVTPIPEPEAEGAALVDAKEGDHLGHLVAGADAG